MWTPQELGFPEEFASFRSAQEEAIEFGLCSESRFTAIGAPPGVGKSGVALALAKLLGGRTVILTANLGLQAQYMNKLGTMGLMSIQGRNNYLCWEGGNCEDGARMECGDKEGCPYMCAFRGQDASQLVVTNYAYWIAVHDKSQGLRAPDTLICDEAGLAFEWLSRALDFTLSERELRESGVKFPQAISAMGEEVGDWQPWAIALAAASKQKLVSLKARIGGLRGYAREKAARDLRHAESFFDRCAKLKRLDDNWVVSREEGTDDGRVWAFQCVWPGRYKESLFRWIPRVILLSATLRPYTLRLLGIARDDCDFREWTRQFPPANGPVIWIPTARVGHRMTDEARRIWLDRNLEAMRWGSDRKGLGHTVSYARAREIADYCVGQRCILNGAADPDAATARDAYRTFMQAPDGTTLLSPSFSTGWDFAGRAAEWQMISKIAFPDTRSKVMQARCETDKSYPNYVAAQDLVQGCGRIIRSADDRGTTLILDDNWQWFGRAASEHFPKWFKVRREDRLPPPLPRLAI